MRLDGALCRSGEATAERRSGRRSEKFRGHLHLQQAGDGAVLGEAQVVIHHGTLGGGAAQRLPLLMRHHHLEQLEWVRLR